MKYSQNDEEKYILEALKNSKGRFLDIGAFDGKTFSNTYALSEKEWSGVCIEPDPYSILSLMKLHKEREDIKIVNAAFSEKRGLTKFWTSGGDAISTTDENHRQKWQQGWKVDFREMHVPTITIDEIFAEFGTQYEFVNLDVEGTNWKLLQTLPLGRMGVKCISIEYDSDKQDIIAYCQQHGLNNLLYTSGENVVISR